jgi:hypothetical protein
MGGHHSGVCSGPGGAVRVALKCQGVARPCTAASRGDFGGASDAVAGLGYPPVDLDDLVVYGNQHHGDHEFNHHGDHEFNHDDASVVRQLGQRNQRPIQLGGSSGALGSVRWALRLRPAQLRCTVACVGVRRFASPVDAL